MLQDFAQVLGSGAAWVDVDHRRIVALTTRLIGAVERGDHGDANTAAADLVATAKAHWEREEAMLRRHGYPRLDGHAQGHAEMLAVLESLQHGSDRVDAGLDAGMVWLLVHDMHWVWWMVDNNIHLHHE